MKHSIKKILSLVLAAAMAVSLAACGGAESAEQTQTTVPAGSKASSDIVNIGVTDTLTSINPLLINGGEINKYAAGLMFLPLVELNESLAFDGMLAEEITTEDNRNFVVHIDPNANWSDGKPVTADDVAYTALRLASPVINNTAMMYYVFEGVGEDGFVEAGADHIDGVKVLDEKTVQFTTKEPMSLTTFQNSYARYLLTLPKHVIEQYSEEELSTADWFNHPDVVSGPYMVTDYDVDHYVSYTANKNYFKGAPKIEKLNIRIVDASQLYAGLQSGELDITQQTLSVIPPEDYESVEAIPHVQVVYGSPVTNQSMFIQTENIPDARVRQAMLCAIDRQQIVEQLLGGHGEVVDGFLSSASPYFDAELGATPYDPEKAKSLLQEAGWDGTQKLRFYVNSGDSTFVNAAAVIAAQWQAVGIQCEIQTVDFATLMTVAGSQDYDVLAVQYTYAPVDPYADMAWLMSGAGSWTGYSHPEIDEALAATQLTSDPAEITALYSAVNHRVQSDVPMISAYVVSAQGAYNKRLSGVTPNVYGMFNNVHEWSLQ